jgi:hypothetical protein
MPGSTGRVLDDIEDVRLRLGQVPQMNGNAYGCIAQRGEVAGHKDVARHGGRSGFGDPHRARAFVEQLACGAAEQEASQTVRVMRADHDKIVLSLQDLADNLDPALTGCQDRSALDPQVSRLADQADQGVAGGLIHAGARCVIDCCNGRRKVPDRFCRFPVRGEGREKRQATLTHPGEPKRLADGVRGDRIESRVSGRLVRAKIDADQDVVKAGHVMAQPQPSRRGEPDTLSVKKAKAKGVPAGSRAPPQQGLQVFCLKIRPRNVSRVSAIRPAALGSKVVRDTGEGRKDDQMAKKRATRWRPKASLGRRLI